MSIGLPTHLLEADFSGTAFGGAFVPTDITRFWRLASDVQVTNWRQDEQSDVSPTTFTIVLDNAALPGDATAPNAGRFTPGLSTSPWYPHVLPAVRLRISETVGGTTFKIADGFALSWTAQYDDDGAFATCTVTCVDILGWMGNLQKLRSILEEEVLLDSPTAFYVLNEAQGSASAGDSSGNNRPAAPVRSSKYGAGTVAFGEDAQPYFGSSVSFDSPDVGSVSVNVRGSYLALPNVLPSSKPFTVEMWFRGPTTNPTPVGADQVLLNAGIAYQPPGTAPGVVDLALRSLTGQLRFTVSGAGVSSPVVLFADSPTSVCDGKWHHVAGVLEADGKTIHLYVDGVLGGTGSTASDIGWLPNLNAPITLGLQADVQIAFPFRGAIAAVAVYATALSTARVLAHAGSAIGYIGESTDAHLTRLLRYRPNLGSVLDAGRGAVGVHDTTGVTLQQALLDTAKAEGGLLYADGQGRIVFLNRSHLYNPASSVTFVAEDDLTVDYIAAADVQRLTNDVRVSRPGGSEQRRQSTTSQTTYGVRESSDTLIVNTDRDALDAGGWKLTNGKDVSVRTPSCTVDCISGRTTAQAQAALARAPLDRITLSGLPASAPPTDVIVQGRTVTIGADKLDVSFFTSPLPRRTLRCDGAASANTTLDNGLVIPW